MANTGNTQQQIAYGATANDGTGDPLRTAFIKTDDNFDNIWLAGPVGSNITVINNTVGVNNTNGNLILSPNGVGVVQTNSRLLPRLNNTYDLGSTTLKYRAGYFGAGGLTVDGNVNITGNLIANSTISGNITANYFVGDGSQLTNIPAAGTSGEVQFNWQGSFSNQGGTPGDTYSTLQFDSNGMPTLDGTTAYQQRVDYSPYLQVLSPRVESTDFGIVAGPSITVVGYDDNYNIPRSAYLSVQDQANATQQWDFGILGYGSNNYSITDRTAGNAWTFGTDGNITLPSNTASINYANGDPYGGSGGGATNLIANGNSYANIATADGNLVVNVGTDGYGTWIFETGTGNLIGPGNASQGAGIVFSADQSVYIREDQGQLNIDAFHTVITSNSGNVGNTQSWNFAADGTLTLPDGSGVAGGFIYGAPGSAGGVTNGGTGYQQFYAQNDGAFVQTSVANAGTTFNTWQFGLDGNLTLPSNTSSINYANGDPYGGGGGANTGNVTFSDQIVIGTGISNLVSGLYLAPSSSSANAVQYLRVRGDVTYEPTHIHFDTGNNQYFNQFIGDDNKYVLLSNIGNIVVRTDDYVGNSAQWTFGANGNLTIPGNIVGGGNILIAPDSANSGGYLDIYLTTGPDVHVASNGDSNLILGRDDYANVTVNENGNVSIQASTGSSPSVWTFDTSGNLTAPGGISTTGNITVGNLITAGSGGDITLTGGNITGAGNIAAGNVSTTGNITAANFFGNGSTLSNVATTFESTWTVPTGNSTQSFTVNSGTYSMWVDCNISNGILVWNATATVTNTNVPVVGTQYAWVYNGGGTPIDFTSIPNQFVGTANAIVRSNTAPSATTNRFDFGINNTSGNSQTVRYGWAQIS